MMPQLQNGIEEILKKNNLNIDKIASIGINCGGPLDSKKGVIMSLPNVHIVPAELHEQIGDIASLSVAADKSLHIEPSIR